MIRRAQPWLGTLVDIRIDDASAEPAMAAAFAAVATVQRLMSFHEAGSDISRFNRADAGDLVEVDRQTWDVLQQARQIADASDGCFDIGCAPRLVEWGYLPAPRGTAPRYLPGQAGYALEGDSRVRKMIKMWIDVGGIAKGHAVDQAIAALQLHGVASACVNAGGDLRVIGPAAWPVSVRAPGNPGTTGARLELRNAALATSANYFSSKQVGGCAVSALLDGRNGRALVDARSVTVIAPRCGVADALTKVVMASGDARHPCLARYGASAFII
jgi:thiamine biosynthesis lipoprotein